MNMLQKLEMLMSEKGINKSQLAEQAGLPKTTVYGWWKKGYEGIRQPTLQKLADYFNVSMEFLISESEGTPRGVDPDRFANLSDEEKQLAKLFTSLPPTDRKTLLDYAHFLNNKQD